MLYPDSCKYMDLDLEPLYGSDCSIEHLTRELNDLKEHAAVSLYLQVAGSYNFNKIHLFYINYYNYK